MASSDYPRVTSARNRELWTKRTRRTRTARRARLGERRRSTGVLRRSRRRSSARSATWPGSTSSSSAAAPPTSRPGSRGAARGRSASTSRRRSSRPRASCRPSSGSSSRSSRRAPRTCRSPTRPSTSRSPSTAPRSGATRTAGSPRRRGCSGPAAGSSSSQLDARRSSAQPDRPPAREQLLRPQRGLHRIAAGRTRARSSSTSAHGEWIGLLRANGFEVERPHRALRARRRRTHALLRLRHGGLGAAVAGRGDLGSPAEVSQPLSPPLLLASTSPQRRAILEQLGLPFDVVSPDYDEDDAAGRRPGRPRARARAGQGALGRGIGGGPARARRRHRRRARRRRLRQAGRRRRGGAHARGARGVARTPSSRASAWSRPAWELVETTLTRVTFRALTPRDLAAYLATRGVGGTRRRATRSRARRGARRADRGRLPERRRPPGGAARAHACRALPGRLRLRLACVRETRASQPRSGAPCAASGTPSRRASPGTVSGTAGDEATTAVIHG